MRDYTDEMPDGAKLAVATGLIAAGGFAAWWLGKPAVKTAGGVGGMQQAATYPGMEPSDEQAGYAAGKHAVELLHWQLQANIPSLPDYLKPGMTTQAIKAASIPPAGHSKSWNKGFLSGFNAAIGGNAGIIHLMEQFAYHQPHAQTGVLYPGVSIYGMKKGAVGTTTGKPPHADAAGNTPVFSNADGSFVGMTTRGSKVTFIADANSGSAAVQAIRSNANTDANFVDADIVDAHNGGHVRGLIDPQAVQWPGQYSTIF